MADAATSGAPHNATIRPMRREDIDGVLGIEGQQFSVPWSSRTFEGLVARPGAELWVVEHDDAGIIAYGVMWCILDQGELANVAVRPEFARQGYARRLLDQMTRVSRRSTSRCAPRTRRRRTCTGPSASVKSVCGRSTTKRRRKTLL